jgi:hypothetical protein
MRSPRCSVDDAITRATEGGRPYPRESCVDVRGGGKPRPYQCLNFDVAYFPTYILMYKMFLFLAALTAKEQVEFAMFTRGSERLIVRGDGRRVNINCLDAARLSARGYRWSGHTHVGDWLMESRGDKIILRQFQRQSRSIIYNSLGKFYHFFPE